MARNHCAVRLQIQPWPGKSVHKSSNSGESVLKKEIPDPLPNGPKPPNLPNDVVGALVVKTIFGPLQVEGAVGNYGRARFFFRVGRIF